MVRTVFLVSSTAVAATVVWLYMKRRRRSIISPCDEVPKIAVCSPDKQPKVASEDAQTDEKPRRRLRLVEANRSAVRDWEARQWAKAKTRMEVVAARAAANAAAGMETLQERTNRLLAEKRAAAEAEGPAAAVDVVETASESPTSVSTKRLTAESVAVDRTGADRPTPKHKAVTWQSTAQELDRWPKPPSGLSEQAYELQEHVWPLYYDHTDWLDFIRSVYSFRDASEVLRHLIFCANGEVPQVKKLIFMVVRCQHCHAGARAGFIPKKDNALKVFQFQMQWLHAVQARSSHPTVEKTVRVLCDYYRKTTSSSPAAEAELFWKNRR